MSSADEPQVDPVGQATRPGANPNQHVPFPWLPGQTNQADAPQPEQQEEGAP